MIVECPYCRQQTTNTPEIAGQVVECPSCRQAFTMPTLIARATKKTTSRRKPLSPMSIVGLVLGVIAVTFSGVVAYVVVNRPPSITPSASTLRRGDVVVLHVSGDGSIFAAASQKDHDRLIDLIAARDSLGIMEMVLHQRAYAIERGTRGRLIGPGFLTKEVRIQSGPHFGKAVIVSSEFVVRAPDSEQDR